MSASFSLEVHLSPGNCGHQQIKRGKKPKHAKPSRLPRITKLMALAIKYEQLLDSGQVSGQDALARLAGIDRSLMSRILRLRLLSPQIQEQLLNLPETTKGREELGLTKLIPLTRIHSWSKQETAFAELLRDLK